MIPFQLDQLNLLEKAIVFATFKHAGQVDKSGNPYILHPIHVMNNVHDYRAKIVAILHDILEDTDTSAADLKFIGCDDEIINAVLCLTKLKNESRFSAAHRAAKNELARIVKIQDVMHNMDLSRLPVITPKDLSRNQEYIEVLKILNFE